MDIRAIARTSARCLAGAAGLATLAYGGYAGMTWLRYGRHAEPDSAEKDALLDTFMPEYDVVERHHVTIDAPADIVMRMAREMDIAKSRIVKTIFGARRMFLRGKVIPRQPRGLLEETVSMGWGVLADIPGREVVVGAATRPWQADPKFAALPPDQFAAFNEPDFVKIVWSLRVDEIGPNQSIFRTETRARATDAAARAKFRNYWSLVSPGVWLIRRLSLQPLKEVSERLARRRRLAA